MWPSALSGRLCIVALVGRYLTNQLMHRRSIHVHGLSHFNSSQMLVCYLSGFSIRFQKLSRAHGQVTYVLLTRSPLDSIEQALLPPVRLACIRHAASVHPEPGSNSPFDLALRCVSDIFLFCLFVCFEIDVSFVLVSCSVFKDRFAPQQCSSIISNTSSLVNYFFYFFLPFFLHLFLYAFSFTSKKKKALRPY